MFENAGDLKIIRFYNNEIASNRRLNKNAQLAHDYDQFVLRVENRNLPGLVGRCYRGPGIPAVVDPVVFDWSRIQTAYQDKANDAMPERLKFTVREYLAQTVAHELAHGVNVWHHGKDLYEPDTLVSDISPNRNRIYDRNNNPITACPCPLESIGKSSGTVESGDLSCLINYYPYYHWGYSVGADGANIYNQVHLLPLGKTLCIANNGTGTNATQLYFGDGSRGNCLAQIKLRN